MNKRKGGAAREREKNKRQLLEVGKKCTKIDNFFLNPATTSSGNFINCLYTYKRYKNYKIPNIYTLLTENQSTVNENKIEIENEKQEEISEHGEYTINFIIYFLFY
jgi:uncharacterized cysteine cluster protein YcgN (CxxCxxCC family)